MTRGRREDSGHANSEGSDPARVPEGALFFYENVCGHYSEALSESERITNGLVYVAPKILTESRYRKTGMDLFASIEGCIKALGALIPRIGDLINTDAPTERELSDLKAFSREFRKVTSALVAVQKKAVSIKPPETLAEVHDALIRVGPELLRCLKPLFDSIGDAIQGKTGEKGLVIEIDLDFSKVPSLERLNSLVNVDLEVLNLLRAGRKIDAVKAYRAKRGVGLVDAKEAVERIAQKHGLEGKPSGCGTVLVTVLLAVSVFCVAAKILI